jgi:hypothetical protein
MGYSCKLAGFVPIGMLEYWNIGIMGYPTMKEILIIKSLAG